MGRIFTVRIDDEDGSVVGFEPPPDVKATYADIKKTPITFADVRRVIIVPVEIFKSNPTCIYLPDGRQICW